MTSASDNMAQQTTQYQLKEAETVKDFLTRPKQDHELQIEYNSFDRKERHFRNFYFSNNIYRSQFANVPLYDEERVQMPSNEFIHASLIITQEGIGGNYVQGQIPLVKPRRPRIDTQKVFWQMIWKLDIEICVCTAHLGKEKHCDFFFKKDVGARYKVDPYIIISQEKKLKNTWAWTYYRLRISTNDKKGDRILHMIMCHGWTDDHQTDKMKYDTLADLLKFVWDIENDCEQQRRSRGQRNANNRPPPTLVLSSAGQNRSGLFVAASIIGREMQRKAVRSTVYCLKNVEDKLRNLRAIRYGVFDRRTNFILLLQTLIEIACRNRIAPRNDAEGARRILRKCLDEIRQKCSPRLR